MSSEPPAPKEASETNETAPRDELEATRSSWGFPSFAKSFPRHPELDRLVAAFTRGDYAYIRKHASDLEAATDDDAVKEAARALRARIEPDPTAKLLFLLAAALLVFLSVFWVLHDGPPSNDPAPVKPTPRAN